MFEFRLQISKKMLMVLAAGAVGLVFAYFLSREVYALVTHSNGRAKKGASGGIGAAKTFANSNFAFLKPEPDDSWVYDDASFGADDERGVVKYKVKMAYADAGVSLSQQEFPKEFENRQSTKFSAFIENQKFVRKQDAGQGTMYFLPVMFNGSPSNIGADTVIFATDSVLLFGRSDSIVGYDAWAKLMSKMQPVPKY